MTKSVLLSVLVHRGGDAFLSPFIKGTFRWEPTLLVGLPTAEVNQDRQRQLEQIINGLPADVKTAKSRWT